MEGERGLKLHSAEQRNGDGVRIFVFTTEAGEKAPAVNYLAGFELTQDLLGKKQTTWLWNMPCLA